MFFFYFLVYFFLSSVTAHAQDVQTYDLFESDSLEQEAALRAILGSSGESVTVVVLRVIRSFLGLFGVLLFVIIVIGGFEWLAAGGNEVKAAESKEMVFQGVIGMAIVLSAFAIVQFFISSLVSGVTS